MGMYTAISLGIELKADTPSYQIDLLRYMVGVLESEKHVSVDSFFKLYSPLPVHPFFHTTRWASMLRCDSYYFDYQTHYSITYDKISAACYLSGVSNLKNYDNEIDLFLDWIGPNIATDGFIGWKMYEEDVAPTMLFKDTKKNQIIQLKPCLPCDMPNLTKFLENTQSLDVLKSLIRFD